MESSFTGPIKLDDQKPPGYIDSNISAPPAKYEQVNCDQPPKLDNNCKPKGEFYFDSSKSVGPNQVDNSNFGES